MAGSSAKRQAEYHRRMQERGMERVAVYLDQGTADLLRQLANDHDKSQRDVIALGIVSASRLLEGRVRLVEADSAPSQDAWRIEI